MTEKPRRKNLRARRKCIFCDQSGQSNPISNEHFWPEWMHPHLPRRPLAYKWHARQVVRLQQASVKRDKPQQGSAYTVTFKVVCKSCNETWMNEIEEKARPILIPMLCGLPITLSVEDQNHLTTWLALKTMVSEQHVPEDAVLESPARTEFMHRRIIPQSLKIWIAAHDLDEWYTGFWHRTISASRAGQILARRGLKNIQTTAFGVGHLFVLSSASTFPDFELNLDGVTGVRQLWPIQDSEIVWPTENLSLGKLNALAEILTLLPSSGIAEWRAYDSWP